MINDDYTEATTVYIAFHKSRTDIEGTGALRWSKSRKVEKNRIEVEYKKGGGAIGGGSTQYIETGPVDSSNDATKI